MEINSNGANVQLIVQCEMDSALKDNDHEQKTRTQSAALQAVQCNANMTISTLKRGNAKANTHRETSKLANRQTNRQANKQAMNQ